MHFPGRIEMPEKRTKILQKRCSQSFDLEMKCFPSIKTSKVSKLVSITFLWRRCRTWGLWHFFDVGWLNKVLVGNFSNKIYFQLILKLGAREREAYQNMGNIISDMRKATVYECAAKICWYVCAAVTYSKNEWRRKKSHAATARRWTNSVATRVAAAWVCVFTSPNEKAFKNSLKSLKWRFLEHGRQTKLPLFSLFHYIISILHECKRHRVVYRYFQRPHARSI